jgi:hypothetical protein
MTPSITTTSIMNEMHNDSEDFFDNVNHEAEKITIIIFIVLAIIAIIYLAGRRKIRRHDPPQDNDDHSDASQEVVVDGQSNNRIDVVVE